MRKILSTILVMALCLSLCACGSSSSSNDNSGAGEQGGVKEEKATTLLLDNANQVENYADFTLFKVQTTKEVRASLDGVGLYYENQNSGETYVDIILDITNKGASTISSDDIVVASAENASGTKYNSCLYVVETNNGTSVSQYENINPLTTVRLHCAISVPETETALTLKLNVNGKNYEYGYSMGKVESSAKALVVGTPIEEADFANMTFTGITYTDDLLPKNTSGAYRHYAVENASNTYLVVKFDITNLQSSDKDCDSFVGVKATYMDKYTYTGFVVVEDEDEKGFSSYEDISPLSTRHFYYLIEIPKTVTENDVTITVSFNGKEYVYTGR